MGNSPGAGREAAAPSQEHSLPSNSPGAGRELVAEKAVSSLPAPPTSTQPAAPTASTNNDSAPVEKRQDGKGARKNRGGKNRGRAATEPTTNGQEATALAVSGVPGATGKATAKTVSGMSEAACKVR